MPGNEISIAFIKSEQLNRRMVGEQWPIGIPRYQFRLQSSLTVEVEIVFWGVFLLGAAGLVSLTAIRVPFAKRSGSSFRQKEKCVFRVFIFAYFFQFCFAVSVCN